MPDGNTVGAATIGGAEGGWWERERATFIVERLRAHGVAPPVVIDLGCGRGELAPVLAEGLGAFVVGCDGEAHSPWRAPRPRTAYVVADLRRPPFRASSVGLVTAFDVLEHFADDQEPLAAMTSLVEAEGHVAVTVPAGPSLWSPFDDAVGHFRRYRRVDLVEAARRAGLRAVDTTSFFVWLVPPAWLLRRRERHGADATDGGGATRLVDLAVRTISRAERAILRRRPLPAGTSLWYLGVPDR